MGLSHSEMSEEIPQKLENNGRNPDGTFTVGHDKIPGSGRPRNSLKDFARKWLNSMTEEEKRAFLKSIDKFDIWRMAEGQPTQGVDGGEDGLEGRKTLLGSVSINGSNNSTQEDNQAQ